MNILLAGEGGQGVQTIAEALAYSAYLEKLHSSYLPQFGVEQRGTPSVAYIQISDQKFSNLKFKIADLVIILRERAIDKVAASINPHTKIVFDSSTISKDKLPRQHSQLLGIPATTIAKENFIPKVFNVVVLGAISKLIYEIREESLWQALEKYLGKKFVADKKIRDLNLKALKAGRDFIFERTKFSQPIFKAINGDIKSEAAGKEAVVRPSLCKGCGICVEKCPVKAIEFDDKFGFFGNQIPKINLDKCIGCGICSLYCPDTAIRVKKNK